jgi:hypothetical protein
LASETSSALLRRLLDELANIIGHHDDARLIWSCSRL